MKCLLIDFGASYIKTAMYDTDTDEYSDVRNTDSPFLISDHISKNELLELLSDIVVSYSSAEAIFPCSILGGFYEQDIYYSWKTNKTPKKNYCLLSGLFVGESSFHVHTHHREFTDVETYADELKILGYINDIPMYSALGDTFCVMNSVTLTDDSVGINLGTGSQVFYKHNNELVVKMYIPSGRMLLMFDKFFNELNFDFFSSLTNITVEDVLNSTLQLNLNVFPQAHEFVDGGHITHITEDTFTVKNLLSSILREYVQQYIKLIPPNTNNIILLGGITKKLNILPDIFKVYCSDKNVIISDDGILDTHLGIVNFITDRNKS
jgi:hypothetical protein